MLIALLLLAGLTLLISNSSAWMNRWYAVLLIVAVGAFLALTKFQTMTTVFGPIKLVTLGFGAWLVAMMRFEGWAIRAWTKKVVFALLSLNILEAVGFEVFDYFFDGTNGVYGGSIWNGLAGMLLLGTLAFPRAITVDANGRQNLRYDLGIGWVLAYTLWNFTFVFRTLAPELLFNEYMAGTILHLSVPLILTLVIGRDSTLYVQMRSISLALFTAAAIIYTPVPILETVPKWHSAELASILAAASFTSAATVSVKHLIYNPSSLAAVNLQQAVSRKIIHLVGLRARSVARKRQP